MQAQWLHKSPDAPGTRLIVFCNGWGMDAQAVAHFPPPQADLLMLYDYRDATPPRLDLTPYARCELLAWSLGVHMSAALPWEFHHAVAVNGTPRPVDDAFGIPCRVYALTEQRFSAASCHKFLRRAGIDPALCGRSPEALKAELAAVRAFVPAQTRRFDAALIASDDLIFPTRNQRAYWDTQAHTRQRPIAAPHYPFAHFTSWDAVLHG